MKNFKQLLIWQKGIEINKKVFDLIESIPKNARYELGPQMMRSAISIPSNIAEGSSRTSKKDYKRYLEFALGSAFELESQAIILGEINSTTDISGLLSLIDEEQKMLMSFMKKVTQSS